MLKLFVILVLLFSAVICKSSEPGYPVCCDSTIDLSLQGLIQDHVDRLMVLRHPDWGWANTPEAVLGIQLGDMQAFFGLNKTIATMETEMKAEINTASVGKLGYYAMAVQSVCEDPREFGGINIIARILTNLKTQFGETTQTQPKDGWYSYGLGIQALCVSNQHVPISTTLRIINGQSSDGSYGTFHSVDETGQMLLAAICARKQVKNNFFLKRWLTLAINKASTFLLTDINPDNTGNIWIGNKYSTPATLLGLQKAGVTFGMCNVIAHNMANGLEATEPEGALSQRLPAMSGKSVLVLGSDDWTCLVPDPIPAGYVPSYTPDATSECYNVSASGHISVKLSVQDSIGANVSGPYDSTQQVNNVENGNTLLQVMTQAQCEGIFQFETTPSSFGEYVVTVNGVTANDTIHQYWALINANTLQYLSVGVSQYVPGDGENILFQLSVW